MPDQWTDSDGDQWVDGKPREEIVVGGGAVLTREVEEIKPRILVTKIESKDQREKLSIDVTDIK